MKKPIILFLYAALLFRILPAQSQSFQYALLVGDTTRFSVSGGNGTVQWQKSPDSIRWADITGATSNPQKIITDTSYSGKRYFRAKIIDSLCPLTFSYSSTIKYQILTSTLEMKIGYWFRGGVVFYIDGTGHGLIAATQDQSTASLWGCNSTLIGLNAQSKTKGLANTNAIVAGCINRPIAASICDTLTLNGYTDWFLPAKDQLNLLYLQKNIVGGLSTYYYWSSTESASTSSWSQYFIDGSQGNSSKSNGFLVRAIRAF